MKRLIPRLVKLPDEALQVTGVSYNSESLADDVRECGRCSLRREALAPVPGRGPVASPVWIYGRNPGAYEDQFGVPFYSHAPAGRMLEKHLRALKVYRYDCYITNVCHCHSEGDRPMRPEEVDACRIWKRREWWYGDPIVVLLMGNDAYQLFFGQMGQSVVQDLGKVIFCGDRYFVPLYHPGYTVRKVVSTIKMHKYCQELRRFLQPLFLEKLAQRARELRG